VNLTRWEIYCAVYLATLESHEASCTKCAPAARIPARSCTSRWALAHSRRGGRSQRLCPPFRQYESCAKAKTAPSCPCGRRCEPRDGEFVPYILPSWTKLSVLHRHAAGQKCQADKADNRDDFALRAFDAARYCASPHATLGPAQPIPKMIEFLESAAG
jgi:hypothetical protein